MKNILLITGNHPRHLYFANYLCRNYPVKGMIIQERENLIPQPPENIENVDRLNFIKHFRNRDLTEKKYFGEQKEPKCAILKVNRETLSGNISAEFVKKQKPDLVFIFGTNMIRDPLFSVLPKYKVNLHLGLSPWYRGDATLFWPFYFLEPNFAGSTFHLITAEPDAGNIIHQTLPALSLTDHIHDIGCKVVIKSTKDALKILKYFIQQGNFPLHLQTQTGKNFLNQDFKPEHLRVIYNLFNDDIVKNYLKGKITCRIPKIHQLDL